MSGKGKWAIEVCRTCHRIAHFPFCEHRDQYLAAYPAGGGPSWYAMVHVTGPLPTPLPTTDTREYD